MTIFIDSSETRTTLPAIPGAVPIPCLEELTGADLMVSPLTIPAATLTLIQRHIAAGALLVQGKWSAGDLAASLVDERMLASLARMWEVGASQVQRVLLYCGTVPTPGSPEYAALSKWADRGGRVEPPLPSVSWVPAWCEMKLRHLAEYEAQPLRWVYGERAKFNTRPEDDPLQLLAEVPAGDPRHVLVALDGVGPTLAQRWWEWSNTHPAECDGTALGIIAQMSCVGRECSKVEGWGKGKAQQVRNHLGIPDGVDFRGYWLAVQRDKREGYKPAESSIAWEIPY